MLLMALFTFREAWRKKIVLLAVVLTLAFLTLYGIGLYFAIDTRVTAATDFFNIVEAITLFILAVYSAGFLVAGLAILSAVGSIAGELENGTLYPLAVRPLSRRSLLLGKYLGLAVMLFVYAALFFLALSGLLYWRTGLVIPGLIQGLGLFILKPLVLLSVTILATTKLSTLGSGIFAFGLYALATAGGMMEQIGVMMGGNTAAIYTGVVTNLLLPADAVYRRLVAVITEQLAAGSAQGVPFFNPQMLFGPFGSDSTPSNWMLVYTIFYVVLTLAAAIRNFTRRDI